MKTNESPNGGAPSGATNGSSELPALPVARAFVLQFGRETDPDSGLFIGRIEHVVSGRRTRFETPEAFLAFVRTILTESPERSES